MEIKTTSRCQSTAIRISHTNMIDSKNGGQDALYLGQPCIAGGDKERQLNTHPPSNLDVSFLDRYLREIITSNYVKTYARMFIDALFIQMKNNAHYQKGGETDGFVRY